MHLGVDSAPEAQVLRHPRQFGGSVLPFRRLRRLAELLGVLLANYSIFSVDGCSEDGFYGRFPQGKRP